LVGLNDDCYNKVHRHEAVKRHERKVQHRRPHGVDPGHVGVCHAPSKREPEESKVRLVKGVELFEPVAEKNDPHDSKAYVARAHYYHELQELRFDEQKGLHLRV